jgi:hypothetical protein
MNAKCKIVTINKHKLTFGLVNRFRHRELEQMEPRLNFQVPYEDIELLILLHTQNKALRHHKPIINDDSHPNFFLHHFINYFRFFYKKDFEKFLVLQKNHNFSEKTPSEGLELVILLHRQH